MRRGRSELVTVGQNPNLQLVGSGPEGGPYDLGLMIGPNGGARIRQTFLLATKTFGAHTRGYLRGLRQYLTIGTYLPVSGTAQGYLLETPVVTPTWKFSDGNVMWMLRKIPGSKSHFTPNASNGPGISFRTANTPSLLFETVTGNPPYVTSTPPYGGRPPGNILVPELGRFFDLRSSWAEPLELDIEISGPCTIAFFASVQQTIPISAGGTQIVPPATPVISTIAGAAPEDAFLQTYSSSGTPVSYIRIAGALQFEYVDFAPSGMPKTYRSASVGDRLTSDRAVTGDNEIRQSGAITSGTGVPIDCEGGKK